VKILVAADGSDYTQRILEFLAKQGWLSGENELTVLTVVMPFPGKAANFADPEKVRKYYDDQAQVVLRAADDWLRDRNMASITFAHEIGGPADCIARRASEGHFDLIAMGARGHGAADVPAPGSVAAKVQALCKTPVVLVP